VDGQTCATRYSVTQVHHVLIARKVKWVYHIYESPVGKPKKGKSVATKKLCYSRIARVTSIKEIANSSLAIMALVDLTLSNSICETTHGAVTFRRM